MLENPEESPASNVDPLHLEFDVISIPLLQEMERAEGQQRLPVLIELNLEYPGGREEAERRVATKLRIARKNMFASGNALFVPATIPAKAIRELVGWNREEEGGKPIHRIWPDFEVEALLTRSVSTIKADAAARTFGASGKEIVWGVIDSGIDASHKHFEKYGNLGKISDVYLHRSFLPGASEDVITDPEDGSGHGTHVAGILAGEYEAKDAWSIRTFRQQEEGMLVNEIKTLDERIQGVAPACKLVSLAVLNAANRGNASSVLQAIDYVQQVNSHGRRLRIHGVNLSLGHEFDPEWFGCGHSPLCTEVNRLVRSGVVVVVSAGNGGYGRHEIVNASSVTIRNRAGGLMMSIMDPGNAAQAITVGSVHRDMPHTYGVSFFSSKGPTADGRCKPDLLAPGERILSCATGRVLEEAEKLKVADGASSAAISMQKACAYTLQSGTSMAAPHVSGAIAGFLSVRPEFIGQPDEVKRLFCKAATDLGRERYFQGYGLIDLMRTLQSV